VQAQPLRAGEWRSYTSMRDVLRVAVTPDSTAAWAVTSGGAFRANLENPNDSVLALRNTNGLKDIELSAVAVDPNGNVYMGAASGLLEIYSEQTGRITHVTDISRSVQSQKKINDINVVGDRVYISTSFGLSIFNRSSITPYFLTTVDRFGTRPAGDSVLQTVESNGTIYAIQTKALVMAQRDRTEPPSWSVVKPDTDIINLTSLAVFKGKVYVGSSAGLFVYDNSGDSLQPVPGANTMNVTTLATHGDSLYVLVPGGGGIIAASNDGVTFSYRAAPMAGASTQIVSLAFAKNTRVYGGFRTGVVVERPGQSAYNVFADGPVSTTIADLAFSRSTGRLYVSHFSNGLSSFIPETNKWNAYSPIQGDIPQLHYKRMFYDSTRSRLWVGTEGGLGSGGFASVVETSPKPQVKLYDANSGIPMTIGDGYIIAGEVALDRNGSVIGATYASNGDGLTISKDGEQFQAVNLSNRWYSYGVLAVDFDNNIWIGTDNHTSDPEPYGLFYVTPDGTVGSISPNSSNSPLTGREINDLLVDQDDALWCATLSGIQIISNLYEANRPTVQKEWFGRSVPLVDQQVVKVMAADGINNKWIGTENGVFVVSPDGSDSLAHFTAENSPLLDNDINSIAIDPARGEAYIGTAKGISRVSTIFKEGKSDYSGLRVYPNPVVQTSEESPTVYIDGLVNGSVVKIYSVSGRHIATVDASQLGNTATWNGRDENGRQLASGVYLLSATSSSTTETGQTKFVIIRRPH